MVRTSKKRSLSRIIVYYLISIGSIFAILTALLTYNFLSHRSKIQYEQKLEEYLVYLKDSLELPIWVLDRGAYEKICMSFAKNDLVGLVQVLDENGDLLIEEGSSGLSGLIIGEANINHMNKNVGRIVLGLRSSVYKQKNRELLYASFFMAAVMILALTLSTKLVLEILLKKPLDDLIQRIQKIAAGNYHQPSQDYEQREIASISTEFNRMAEQINKREIALLDAKKELENEIADRKQIQEDKKKMESQLQQSQKMEAIGTLAGGIAHDFNNILFPILGYSEMLLDDVTKDSPFQDGLDKIHTGALRAKDLVKQILTFSRQEKSDLKLMKIQPIIKEALRFIRSTIPTTIDIKQEIHAECGVIKADPTQIHQIIMNLTTNAYHAMEETGGELKVSLKEIELGEYDLIRPDMIPGYYACLKVADTGVGMNKDLTKKIFDPFFTTKEKGKGTGMGLSVVYGIVNSMGGAIQVYSEPGKGAEFKVYIAVEKSFSEEQQKKIKQSIQGGTEHILLIDDEEAIITMEKQMLERLGYNVISCTSSIEALEAFRVNPDIFDLVITDMAMPNMSGEKLAVELNKIRPDIPILLCTGFSENMPQEKAASLGIKGFLIKPVVMKDLAQKIREVLDEKGS